MTTSASQDEAEQYYRKALLTWEGANSELAAGRFDNAIALAYYACFQLGVSTMALDGITFYRREGYSHGLAISEIARRVESSSVGIQPSLIRAIYGERLSAQYRHTLHTLDDTLATLRGAGEIIGILRTRLDAVLETSTTAESPDGNSTENN